MPAPSTSPAIALPVPDPDARAHSEAAVASVRRAIQDAGGWIPFADYMQRVLYAPGLGYYVAGARKFGAAGDFVTAPEITPLFGRALAGQVAEILAVTKRREVLELGAGSGRLAADLLLALEAARAPALRYRIVEVSPELRLRQRETIARSAPRMAARVEWLDALPDGVDGAVIANEVLDAVPPHLVARRAGAWLERGVACEDGGSLRFEERPLADERLRALASQRFPGAGDYLGELNPAAEARVEDVGRRIVGGAMLVIDYGFPRRELYHPQRDEGTLMGHYRHRSHGDPFLWPGLSDLTTHVDFTAIAEAGTRAGLVVEGFASQAAFLLGCGLLDRLAECGDPGSVDYVRATSVVNRLVSPAEMGELFKVLALARTPGIRWPGFSLGDARHRL
jgi:SAM-dependent MidA family methyltransferase